MIPNIGLLGKKRVGKNAVADVLTEQYGHVQMGFADPMREMAEAIDPIIDPVGGLTYNEAIAEFGYDIAKELYPELRRFLQVLGTEAGRTVFGENVWVDALMARANESDDPVVVTDVRFPNEADALRRAGFLLVRVTRPVELRGTTDSDSHVSEIALDEYAGVDWLLPNSGTLEDLNDAICKIVDLETRGITLAG